MPVELLRQRPIGSKCKENLIRRARLQPLERVASHLRGPHIPGLNLSFSRQVQSGDRGVGKAYLHPSRDDAPGAFQGWLAASWPGSMSRL